MATTSYITMCSRIGGLRPLGRQGINRRCRFRRHIHSPNRGRGRLRSC